MFKKALLLIFSSFLFLGTSLKAQHFAKNAARMLIAESLTVNDSSSQTFTSDNTLNQILSDFNVTRVAQVYPILDTIQHPIAQELRRQYTVLCDSCNEDSLAAALESHGLVEETWKIELIEIELLGGGCEEPSDYNQYNGNTPPSGENWAWHLDMIRAKEAWAITTGREEVKVGVVDISFTESSEPPLTVSDCEITPDLITEISFPFLDCNNPALYYAPCTTLPCVQPPFHGKRVAGCVSGATDNGITEMSSIGWSTSVLGITIRSHSGIGAGIFLWNHGDFDADGSLVVDPAFVHSRLLLAHYIHGAEILSMSFAFRPLEDPIDYHHHNYRFKTAQNVISLLNDEGVVVVAAAGNANQSSYRPFSDSELNNLITNDPNYHASSFPDFVYPSFFPLDSKKIMAYSYPASYNGVISVTSVGSSESYYFNYSDNYDSFNSGLNPYGYFMGGGNFIHAHNDRVDLSAPGFSVPLLNEAGSLTPIKNSGTSFSTPIVAGTVSLMRSVNPCLSPAQVEAILKCTAVDVNHVRGNHPYANHSGAGRLDAYEAVRHAAASVFMPSGEDICNQPLENICPNDEGQVYTVTLNGDFAIGASAWEVSSHFTIVSSDPKNLYFQLTDPNAACRAWIKADVIFDCEPFPISVRKDIHLLCGEPQVLTNGLGIPELCEGVLGPGTTFYSPVVQGATSYEWTITPAPLPGYPSKIVTHSPSLDLQGFMFEDGRYTLKLRAVREVLCEDCSDPIYEYTDYDAGLFDVAPKATCNPDCNLILDLHLSGTNLDVGVWDLDNDELYPDEFTAKLFTTSGTELQSRTTPSGGYLRFDLMEAPCPCDPSLAATSPNCDCDNGEGGGIDSTGLVLPDIIISVDFPPGNGIPQCVLIDSLILETCGEYTINVAPNPASTYTEVWLDDDTDPSTTPVIVGGYDVNIYDDNGNFISTGLSTSGEKVYFNTSGYMPGVYYAYITHSDCVYIKRFIRE